MCERERGWGEVIYDSDIKIEKREVYERGEKERREKGERKERERR